MILTLFRMWRCAVPDGGEPVLDVDDLSRRVPTRARHARDVRPTQDRARYWRRIYASTRVGFAVVREQNGSLQHPSIGNVNPANALALTVRLIIPFFPRILRRYR